MKVSQGVEIPENVFVWSREDVRLNRSNFGSCFCAMGDGGAVWCLQYAALQRRVHLAISRDGVRF